MVRLRLQRHGRKKLPYYHIVAADVRTKRDGRIIEDLGRFSPTQEPNMVRLETERVLYWLKSGAQPTDTVRNILKKEGIYFRLHLERWGKSKDEIDSTIAEWKDGIQKSAKKANTKAQRMKDQLKAEDEKFKKDKEAQAIEQAEKEKADAEAARKAEEEAAKAKEAEAKQEPEAEAGDTSETKGEEVAEAKPVEEAAPAEENKPEPEVEEKAEAKAKEDIEEKAEDRVEAQEEKAEKSASESEKEEKPDSSKDSESEPDKKKNEPADKSSDDAKASDEKK